MEFMYFFVFVLDVERKLFEKVGINTHELLASFVRTGHFFEIVNFIYSIVMQTRLTKTKLMLALAHVDQSFIFDHLTLTNLAIDLILKFLEFTSN